MALWSQAFHPSTSSPPVSAPSGQRAGRPPPPQRQHSRLKQVTVFNDPACWSDRGTSQAPTEPSAHWGVVATARRHLPALTATQPQLSQHRRDRAPAAVAAESAVPSESGDSLQRPRGGAARVRHQPLPEEPQMVTRGQHRTEVAKSISNGRGR